MGNIYNWNHIRKIREQPHLLGLLAGKSLLTPMHSEWIKYMWCGNEDRALLGHRGSYKTTAVSEIGTIFWLLFNPNDRVAILRKNYTASAEVIRNIANIMEMDTIRPLLELAWGEKWKFTIKRDGKLEISAKKNKTKESSVTALGIDSGITGLHFDKILGDDVVDLDDRLSEAERNHTIIVVQEIRANVIDRGKYTSWIGTPWHPHDAWSKLPLPKRYPVSQTGLITPEQMEDIKTKTTSVLYSCNYDLEFKNTSDMPFADPRMGVWHGDKLKNIKAHIDAAFKGSHYCALTIMGENPENNKLNAVGFVYAGNMKDWMATIVQKIEYYGAKELFSEENADKGYSADIIGLHPRMRDLGVWISTYHELERKNVKIINYLGEAWKNIEWADETDPNYLEQIVDWVAEEEPDDAPDSAASLIREGQFSTTNAFNNWNVWQM